MNKPKTAMDALSRAENAAMAYYNTGNIIAGALHFKMQVIDKVIMMYSISQEQLLVYLLATPSMDHSETVADRDTLIRVVDK